MGLGVVGDALEIGDDECYAIGPEVSVDERLRDVGVRDEPLFQFLRSDELPSGGFDEVFFAVGNAQKPLRIEATDIPGMEPPVTHNLARLLRLSVVALHDVRASCQDLPVLGDQDFGPLDQKAHRPEFQGLGPVDRDHR